MKNKINDARNKLCNSFNNLQEQICTLKNTFLCELISTIENIAGPGHYIRFDVVCDDVFEYEYNVAEIIGVKVYADEIYLLENDEGWIPLHDFEYEDYNLDTFIRLCFDSNNLIVRCDTHEPDIDDINTNNTVYNVDIVVYCVNISEQNRTYVESMYPTKEDAQNRANYIARNKYVLKNGLRIVDETSDYITLAGTSPVDDVKISITKTEKVKITL